MGIPSSLFGGEGTLVSIKVCNIYQLLPSFLSPTITHTEVKDVALKDLEEFPLDIMICVKPALDTLALQNFGYPSEYHYTVGLNEDESLVGWGGYNNQSEPVAS